MIDNLLMAVKQEIKVSKDSENVEKLLIEALDGTDKFYSYIIYAKYDEGTLVSWTIQYNLSQIDEYNTLERSKVIKSIMEDLKREHKPLKNVIGYGQPSFDIIVQAYDPLVHKLAKQQGDKWKQYEHDDLCQICRLVMLKLYRKGYYIHRRLLYKAFQNEIWMDVKKHRGMPEIVSLEDTFYCKSDGDSEALSLSDVLADKNLIEEEERKWKEEGERLIFEEIKDIIIDYIGVRQWNELLRDYGNGHTTSATRIKMHKIKAYLSSLGLSRKDFNNKYYG